MEEIKQEFNENFNFKNNERINLAINLIEEKLKRHNDKHDGYYDLDTWFDFIRKNCYIVILDNELEQLAQEYFGESLRNEKGRGSCYDRGSYFYFYQESKINLSKPFILLQDKYETIESLAWIILHELGHAYVSLIERKFGFDLFRGLKNLQSEDLGLGLWGSQQHMEYYSTDEGHEKDVEEQIVNIFANTIIGQQLDRIWWSNHKKECLEKENK